MKKLDKLILRAFTGPFLLTFAVVQFILLTQYMLKYLDDLVGKDLGIEVIGQLLFFFSVLMVPVSLPLAVLLSSLMTFGTLGEHHELTAIKTSGISLTRILRPVLITSMLLAVFAFWFNNTIVPKANLKAYSLLWDLRQQKLALDIRPNVFYNGIPGYTIKVNDKLGEDGEILMGVMIYDHTQGSGSMRVILADSGRMFTRFGGQYLGLELFRGQSYVEQPDASSRTGATFIRQAFARNMITFSLASFDLDRTKEELFSDNKMMKNVGQLEHFIDSVQTRLRTEQGQVTRLVSPYYTYLRFDTTGRAANNRVAQWQVPTTRLPVVNASTLEQASNRARNVRAFAGSTGERLANLAKETSNYRIEVYRKYVQSTAILLMFLIGAPLGAIIKKGGLGVPILVSILFFIVYYIFSIIGEKYGREGVMPVEFGMWMSTLVLLPFGLFFLYQARNDSGLLDWNLWEACPPRFVGLSEATSERYKNWRAKRMKCAGRPLFECCCKSCLFCCSRIFTLNNLTFAATPEYGAIFSFHFYIQDGETYLPMKLTTEVKQAIFEKNSLQKVATDTGSAEAQIALFTHRITHLTEHLKVNKKDFSTRLGLLKLVGKRRRMLDYLQHREINRYRAIIKELGIRK